MAFAPLIGQQAVHVQGAIPSCQFPKVLLYNSVHASPRITYLTAMVYTVRSAVV